MSLQDQVKAVISRYLVGKECSGPLITISMDLRDLPAFWENQDASKMGETLANLTVQWTNGNTVNHSSLFQMISHPNPLQMNQVEVTIKTEIAKKI